MLKLILGLIAAVVLAVFAYQGLASYWGCDPKPYGSCYQQEEQDEDHGKAAFGRSFPKSGRER